MRRGVVLVRGGVFLVRRDEVPARLDQLTVVLVPGDTIARLGRVLGGTTRTERRLVRQKTVRPASTALLAGIAWSAMAAQLLENAFGVKAAEALERARTAMLLGRAWVARTVHPAATV